MPEALREEVAGFPAHWFGSFLEPMYATASPGSGEWALAARHSLRDLLTAEKSARRIPMWRGTTVERRNQEVAVPAIIQVGRSDLEASLFKRRWQLKLMTSQVAMHLSPDVHSSLARAIDDLLDLEGWHADDALLADASFATFLRLLLFERTLRLPGFGISQSGNLLAGWIGESGRLIFELLPEDRIRWSLSCDREGKRERAAGEVDLLRLREVLVPYPVLHWYLADAAPPAHS